MAVDTVMGYTQVAALTAAAAQPLPSIPTGAVRALVIATEPIRVREDGVEPTAAVGMPVAADTYVEFSGSLGTVSLIAQVADAVLDITYYANA
jgi:hypothetical protein